MPGFPLAAIGAGIGRGVQQVDEHQAAMLQQVLQQLKLKQQQQQDQASAALFSTLASGGIQPLSPGGGGLNLPGSTMPAGGGGDFSPQSLTRPASPMLRPGADVGGGMRTGGAFRNAGDAWLNQNAPFPTVGRPNPTPGPSNQNDPTSILPAGGGDVTPLRAPPKPPIDGSYALPGPGGPATQGGGAGRPAPAAAHPLVQEAQQTAAATAQTIPPEVYGRMSLQALAQQIDKANPSADPVVKMMALEQAAKLLAPSEQRAWEMFTLQHRETLALEKEKRDRQFEVDQQRRSQGFSADQQQRSQEFTRSQNEGTGQIIETDKGPMRIPRGSDKAVPIDTGGAHVVGARGGQKEANILAFDKDGKRVFEGNAVYDPQTKGWANSATGDPIVADRVETTGKGAAGAAGSAGRGGAQVQRQIIAGREIQSDLEAITKLPISVDRGIFGGRQQGPGLFDAMKENLAETLTDEDAQLANSALAGLERELSVVTSPVYGGKWAAQSFGALNLKPGQTVNVKLYNIARMRQVVDNALEGVINTDWVGREQKEYAQKIRNEIDKAVPWSIQDVITFRQKGKSGESFRDFVDRNNVSGAAGRQGGATPAAGPQEGDTATNPQTNQKLMFHDGKWGPVI